MFITGLDTTLRRLSAYEPDAQLAESMTRLGHAAHCADRATFDALCAVYAGRVAELYDTPGLRPGTLRMRALLCVRIARLYTCELPGGLLLGGEILREALDLLGRASR